MKARKGKSSADEFSHTLKIPADRVGVLIGTSGSMKKHIERATNTQISVDSKEGEVTITSDDGINLYDAREVIHAIARGFNPEVAMRLLKGEYSLEIIDIADYAGKSKNTADRLRGRVIGAEGKARREIEHLTDTSIQVYGKTIAIIGEIEHVSNARHAVGNLLAGATHAAVYRFLEKKQREYRMRKRDEEVAFSGAESYIKN